MTRWQAEDNGTDPAISFDLKKFLQAASRTIKFDTGKLNLVTDKLSDNALPRTPVTAVFALQDSDVVLTMHVADRVVIGRLDVDSNDNADIDLMRYGARAQGVSRRHAALYPTGQELSLIDLKSSNGTYVNGHKLTPHQACLLHEGDEVCLGTMRFRVSYDR